MDVENNPSFQNATVAESKPDTQEQASNSRFSISYWQQYFDLEEQDMKDRLMACVKMSDKSLAEVLDKDGDDLYGPYWLATTLIVVLFIAGKNY